MPNEGSYPLTRGLQQLVRVHLVQQLWRDTNEYLVHPAVQLGDGRTSSIADVGTASGLWLCELSRSVDKMQKFDFHGFDISDKSFIPKANLPLNVHLHVADARVMPSMEYRGKFDFVHVRLLQPVITDDDPKWMIEHCMQLLRPGGYLQWEEYDPVSFTVHSKDGFGAGLRALCDQLHTRTPLKWIESLPQHMKESDMQVVAVQRRYEPAFHHSIVTYLHCLVFDEYAHYIGGEIGEKLLSTVKSAREELQHGAYVEYLFQTVLAKKKEK